MGRLKNELIELQDLRVEAEQLDREAMVYEEMAREAFRQFDEDRGLDLSAEASELREKVGRIWAELSHRSGRVGAQPDT